MTAGEMSGLDEDGNVALSEVTRAGQIIYTSTMMTPDDQMLAVLEGTDPMKAKEWNELEITFTWEAGEPALNTGSVTVSYHPVTDDVSKMTAFCQRPHQRCDHDRRLHHDAAVPVRDQPEQGFNTGLAITNASEGSGSCTIEYSGPDAPDDMMTPEDLAGEEQWVGLLSNMAPGFQGYITASCEFRDAHGFAFITGRGETPPGAGLSRGVHELRLGRPIA